MRESFLEIDSKRLRHNLQVFKKKLSPNTRILANLKANAYGIGAFETGQILEQAGVSYFSVAFINEGIYLREKGIQTNLLVFNPSFEHFQELIDYRLEPEVSSIHYLEVLKNFLVLKKIKHFPVHLKLDTGMHRAGIMPDELPVLINLLKDQNAIQVKSVFSHLAVAEDANEDDFTKHQIQLFEQMTGQLRKELPYNFFRHLLNTAGAFRFPEAQYDMIRPGLGLFGYNLMPLGRKELQPIVQLKTKINQVKILHQGDTVGYSRNFKVTGEQRIGLLPLGYADGIDRRLSNFHHFVKCRGYQLPIVGNISMDTMSIDLTGTPCKPGDTVTVIDNEKDAYEIAAKLETIPYEIITGFSRRLIRTVI